MARGRFLSKTISTDVAVNSLSIEAQLLYVLTIPHLDRDGLIHGDSMILFGKICPRRPEFMDRIDGVIAEWVDAGLVTEYMRSHFGRILYFHGFTKNQQNMRYDREAASEFPPPDGYIRTDSGLLPDEVRTNSGDGPAEVKAQDQPQVEVEEQQPERGGGGGDPNQQSEQIGEIIEFWIRAEFQPRADQLHDTFVGWVRKYGNIEVLESLRIALHRMPNAPAAFVEQVLQNRAEEARRAQLRKEHAQRLHEEVNFGMLQPEPTVATEYPEDDERTKTIRRVIYEIEQFQHCPITIDDESGVIYIEFYAPDWANMRAKNQVENRLRSAKLGDFDVQFKPVGMLT